MRQRRRSLRRPPPRCRDRDSQYRPNGLMPRTSRRRSVGTRSSPWHQVGCGLTTQPRQAVPTDAHINASDHSPDAPQRAQSRRSPWSARSRTVITSVASPDASSTFGPRRLARLSKSVDQRAGAMHIEARALMPGKDGLSQCVPAMCSARYSASLPTPENKPDLNVCIQCSPRKYIPGRWVVPRCWTGRPCSSNTGTITQPKSYA